MNEHTLDELEKRIEDLEKDVFSGNSNESKMMKTLGDVNDALATFSKRDRFKMIFKRVPDLIEYLSPGFIDSVSANKDCEKEVVLSAEHELKEMAEQFNEIDKLSKVLDDKHISQVPTYQMQLTKLESIQQQQLAELSESDALDNLLNAYNELGDQCKNVFCGCFQVAKLSESFAKWDLILSNIEGKEQE